LPPYIERNPLEHKTFDFNTAGVCPGARPYLRVISWIGRNRENRSLDNRIERPSTFPAGG